MKHWTPRRPLAIVLIMAFALGIASSGCAISWPWSQPSQETLSRTPVPTEMATVAAETQTPNADAATVAAETQTPNADAATVAETQTPNADAATVAETQTPNADAATQAVVTPEPTLVPIELRATEESAQVRVLLKSLEAPVALGMTVTGPYSIEKRQRVPHRRGLLYFRRRRG